MSQNILLQNRGTRGMPRGSPRGSEDQATSPIYSIEEEEFGQDEELANQASRFAVYKSL